MTPKEKAKELVDKFRDYAYSYELVDELEDTEDWNAKQCALMCVDEYLADLIKWNSHRGSVYEYWQEVKQQIKKL